MSHFHVAGFLDWSRKQLHQQLCHRRSVLCRCAATLALLLLIATVPVPPAAAQSTGGGVSLSYIPGSSVKLEQVIGDCDWQVLAQKGTCLPTASQTVTRFNILGNGQGGSFEDNGKMIFLFGDTISKDVNAVNYHAADPLAWSTSTDPEAGLLLNFFTLSDGSPLFVKPPGIPMGPDAIPNAGINVNGQIYLVCNIGSDTSLADPQSIDTSVLVQFNEAAQTFTGGRTISQVGGHFIGTSMHASGSYVYIFGAGPYRVSDIYLQRVPASSFASGAGTEYFAGLVNGQPTWVNSEAGTVPVVQDNPLNGPAWPNDTPSVGNLSVAYSNDLGLWLMTFDGGKNTPTPPQTRGTYFSYAQQPWGPWSTPQLIFNEIRDHAYGVYIHNPSILPDPPGDGLNGPVIGSNDPYTTAGGAFAPLLIERFIRVVGDTLKIYYNVSTWNPYTVVKMRSEFKITHTAQINTGGIVNNASYTFSISPGSIAALFGTNLTDGTSCLPPSCNPSFDKTSGKLGTTMAGAQATVNGTPVPIFYAAPTQLGIQIPFELTGTSVGVAVSVAGQTGSPTKVTVAPVSPGIFTATADGKGVGAITHVDGSAVTIQNPAKRGDLVILYVTGLGQVVPAVATGALPTAASNTVSPVTLSIGGINVIPDFAGLAGCCVGLNQINAKLPAGVSPGNAVPVVLSIGGQSSNAATIAVQ